MAQMSIICGIVAYKDTILATCYLDNNPQLPNILKYILQYKLTKETQSFEDHDYYYHCLMSNDYRYIVVSTSSKLTNAYKCLYNLRDTFVTLNHTSFEEHSLNPIFASKMESILKVHQEADPYENLREVIVHNLELK